MRQDTAFWRIEARAFPIAYTPFTHNFWLLITSDLAIAGQLHGLAVNPRTGRIKAIGNAGDRLQVVSDASITWSLRPGLPAVTAAAGDASDILNIWQCALNAMPAINALHLPYPNLWQHWHKPNSNSIFSTLGRIMGFASPATLLPTLAPGSRRLLPKELIQQYVKPEPPGNSTIE